MSMFLWLILVLAFGREAPREPVGRIDAQRVPEVSGIVASRRFPGIFWVHSDSGNPPKLFAIRRDGSLVKEYRVAAPNLDWEDIAIDDAGHLYLGDIGNNGSRLALRVVHRLDEPDPARNGDEPLRVTASSWYRFDDVVGRFDAESLFFRDGRAVVVSKLRDGREAVCHAIPFDPPAPLLNPAVPSRLATLPEFVEPATGADLSGDGRFLAVCSSEVVRVYQQAGDDPAWRLMRAVRYPSRQVEAVAWDGDDLLLVSEDGAMSRVSDARRRSATASKPGVPRP